MNTTTPALPQTTARETYSLRQVADKLGLNERTIRRKLKAGLLPIRPLDRFTQQYLFPKAEVDQLVAGQLRRPGRRY